MKLQTVTYGRMVTDGDYGSYHLEVTIELEEGDSGRDALKAAHYEVISDTAMRKAYPQLS